MSTTITKKDTALFILRVIPASSMLLFHGLPKLMAGEAKWKSIGMVMGNLGIKYYPVLWGFSAALIESLGALLLILGLWTRINSILLTFTMLIAMLSHISAGQAFATASHSMELIAVFFAVFLLGPGRYSIDKK